MLWVSFNNLFQCIAVVEELAVEPVVEPVDELAVERVHQHNAVAQNQVVPYQIDFE